MNWFCAEYYYKLSKNFWLVVYCRPPHMKSWTWYIGADGANSSIAKEDRFDTAWAAGENALAYIRENEMFDANALAVSLVDLKESRIG